MSRIARAEKQRQEDASAYIANIIYIYSIYVTMGTYIYTYIYMCVVLWRSNQHMEILDEALTRIPNMLTSNPKNWVLEDLFVCGQFLGSM